MTDLRQATPADMPRISALLDSARLSTDGVADRVQDFIVAESAGRIVGVAGMEDGGLDRALLRSVVVHPERRQQGLARRMLEEIVARCRVRGIRALYLLTLDAQGCFFRQGFRPVPRSEAPAGIRATSQFAGACPESAALMVRELVPTRGLGETAGAADPAAESRQHFDRGFYCAESVLLALAKRCGVDSPLVPSIATGLCSGVARTGGMCGAVGGAILGLGLAFGRERHTESVTQSYDRVRQLMEEFRRRHGSTNCRELLGCHLGTPEGQLQFREQNLRERCAGYTASATEIATRLIDSADG